MRPISDLKELLSSPKKIFITTHRKPDGDALGSTLALFHYFLKKGHEPVVVSPTDYGLYLHWMPGNPSVLVWEENKEKCLAQLQLSDLIICCDFNALNRIDDMGESIRVQTKPKVMIDHHLDPEGFEDYRLWSPDACATTQLVYDFFTMMGDEALVDKNIATCIYTGLITDSGSFRYPNVTADVHRMVAKLLDAGLDHTSVHRNVFDTMNENKLRFFGHCLINKMVILPEYRAAYISVSRQELQKYQIGTGETEGLVNYAMSLSEVIFGALIVEREGIVKLSLRSKGSFPANEVARKYFTGGGHLNAAGGSSYFSLDETIAKFVEACQEYRELLQCS